MARPPGGDRPAVPAGDTALHAWLVDLIEDRLDELGWLQVDLRRAIGGGGSVSEVLRGVRGGSLAFWQRMIDTTGATLPDLPPSTNWYPAPPEDLHTFLVRLVETGGGSESRTTGRLTTREVARRAGMSEAYVGAMMAGKYGGSLPAWQRLLDAVRVRAPARRRRRSRSRAR